MANVRDKSRRNHLLVLGLFAVLTLLMTWPVIGRLGTHLAGGRDDLWVHQWTFWWIREALREGLNPFFTVYLYAPNGASLTSHNIAWFNIALWLPLQAVLGRVPAYNLVFLLVIFLNGTCMYFFAWSELRSYGAALVAGLIFGFWPYTLSHYDHANMMVVFWVPLTLLLLNKLIMGYSEDLDGNSRQRWLLVLLTALSLAMIGITRWQLLIMSSPILLGYILYLLWLNPQTRNRATVIGLLAAAGISLLIMAPLVAPLVVDQFVREFPQDVLLDEAVWGRTDLLAYFVPSIHHGLWRAWVKPIYDNFVVNQFYTPFLGYVTLLLAFTGAISRWKRSWIWLLLAAGYALLALGPELALNGESYPAVPMPYRLVENFFLMHVIRRPDRLNVFLGLPLAMLAGWGLQAILNRTANIMVRRLLVLGVVVLILFAYWPVPFATTLPETPAWYAEATAEGESFAVLDLPINDRSYDKWYMQYQTDHGLPIATGHVSRLPSESTAFLDGVPLVANLTERDQLPDHSLTDISSQLQMLADGGIHYLIVHKQFANEGLQAEWRDWLAIDPVHEDGELIVYRTNPEFGRDFEFEYGLNDSIGIIEIDYAPVDSVQGGLIRVNSVWGARSAPGEEFELCLMLMDVDGTAVAENCLGVDTEKPTSNWKANEVLRSNYYLPVPATLDPGTYDLTVALTNAESDLASAETAKLGQINVHPFSETNRSAAATWSKGINLRGGDFKADDDTLSVTLYWQTDESIENSYKVFLHIKDANSGEVAAQSDSIPRNWRYPTTDWQPGEIVRDQVKVPLDNLASDSHEIVVGLYDEESGERLHLVGENAGQDSITLGTWDR